MSSLRVARVACAWLPCALAAGHVGCSGTAPTPVGDVGSYDATDQGDIFAASDDGGSRDAKSDADATLTSDATDIADGSEDAAGPDAVAEAGFEAGPDDASRLDSGAADAADAADASLNEGRDADPGDAATDAATNRGTEAGAGDAGASTIVLTMDAFVVPANGEVDMCQPFANPFGRAVDLVSMDGAANAGVSAFFAFNMAPDTGRNATAPLQACSGAELHPFAYFSQQQGHFVESYPQPNMGYALAADHGLMLYVHYVNANAQPMNGAVSITLEAAATGVVTTHVGHILLDNAALSVPPLAKKDAAVFTSRWDPVAGQMPASYAIFRSTSRMFPFGLDFVAGTNGTAFYEETQWSAPPVFAHHPEIAMTGSASIGWACTYYNPTGAVMTAGPSLRSNVQCRYVAEYYSSAGANPDVIISR